MSQDGLENEVVEESETREGGRTWPRLERYGVYGTLWGGVVCGSRLMRIRLGCMGVAAGELHG